MTKLKIIILNKKFFEKYGLPTKATSASAATDVRSMHDVIIQVGETHMFPLGFNMWIKDESLCAMFYSRSGLSTKRGGVLANACGVIDSDYQGEWHVPIRNHSKEPLHIEVGERIAQFKLEKVIPFEYEVVEDFISETLRGKGGFGHTGVK